MLRNAHAILLFLSSTAAFTQTQAAPPAFEVADVKVNKSGELRMAIDIQPGGRVTMRNVPMKVLIVFAYHLRPEALAGGPKWLESERFDVVAKAPETASPDDVRRMAQTLLAERFKLVVHKEQKIMPAYALVLGKFGPKLQPSETDLLSGQRCVPGQGQPDQRHVECRHITLALLADYLQELAPRDFMVPVVDQTGLKGAYDFKLDWTPTASPTAAAPSAENAPATAPPVEAGPTIFDAVQLQLGLKLESKRLPLPIIVVDHVERVPSEN
jgi:uncharacterized protein (TIGR03435 family)